MPNPTLDAEFSEAHDRYFEAANALVPLLVRVALSRLGEVLPGAYELEAEGRFTEDWIRTLRIQRVLDQHGAVLFDVGFGHPDRRVEDAIDDVNSEYLDFLLDLTGDTYMDHTTIDPSHALES